jgi:hypothetical protein
MYWDMLASMINFLTFFTPFKKKQEMAKFAISFVKGNGKKDGFPALKIPFPCFWRDIFIMFFII